MTEPVLVIFEQPHGVYLPGDLAGFTPDGAARILSIQRGQVGSMTPIARRATKSDVDRAAAPAPAKPVEELVAVRFRIGIGRYLPDEVASFPASIAKQYAEGRRDKAGFHPPVADYHRPPREAKGEGRPAAR